MLAETEFRITAVDGARIGVITCEHRSSDTAPFLALTSHITCALSPAAHAVADYVGDDAGTCCGVTRLHIAEPWFAGHFQGSLAGPSDARSHGLTGIQGVTEGAVVEL